MTKPELAPGLILRPMRRGDLEGAHRLSAGEGWPHRREDWAMMLSLGDGAVIEDADAGGRVAGVILWWHWGEMAATLGMVLVARDRQRQGLGRRLMGVALAACGDRAIRLHATEAGLALYQSLAFEAHGRVEQWQGVVARPVASRPAVAPAEAAGLIRAADEAAFGASRRRLIARLAGEGAGADDAATGMAGGIDSARQVLAMDGCLAVRRSFGRGVQIGPLLAVDAEAAARGLAASLGDGFCRVDLLDPPEALSATLAAAGLGRVDVAIPMTQGRWPSGAPGWTTYGLVSQAFG